MIKITLEFATTEAAITALAAVRSSEGKSDAPKPEPKAETPKPDAKPKKAAAETPPTAATTPPAASPTPEPESKSPTTSSEPVVTREQVSAAVVAAAKTNRAAVVEALGKFGAKAAKDLKDEQLLDFYTTLEAATRDADLG